MLAPLGEHRVPHELQPRSRERRPRPGQAVLGCGIGRVARHVCDAGASAGDQVLHRHTAARVVVRGEGEIALVIGRRVRVDDRNGKVLAQRGAGVGLAAHDDDPVDAPAQEGFEVVLLADRVATRITEEDVDLTRPERVFRPHEDGQHESAFEVAREEADGSGSPGEQAARHLVRCEGEFLGGREHTRARRRGDVVATVQRFRCGRDGYAGPTGDVIERRGAHGPFAGWHEFSCCENVTGAPC